MSFEPRNIRKTRPYNPCSTCSKYILDVDTGCDDAQFLVTAIHLAKKMGKEIIGITCVDGNTELKNAVLNTLIVLNICKAPIKIYKGAKVNMQGFISKSTYFGSDGLGNQQGKYELMLSPDDWDLIQDDSAFDFISKSAKKYGKELGIICTGPLTNIAIAWMLNNELPNMIGGLAVVGGSFSGVGVTGSSYCTEFNFNADADAAALVLKWFKQITLVPLELAYEAPREQYNFPQFFNTFTTQKGRFIMDIFQSIQHMVFDPVAVFAMMMPESVTCVYRLYGEVMREGPRTKGFLSLDWLRTKENNEPNLQIVCDMDWKLVSTTILESLQDD